MPIFTDWRKNLADEIRTTANSIYENADKLADQPDYMTDFDIWIRFDSDGKVSYEVTHSHVVASGGET